MHSWQTEAAAQAVAKKKQDKTNKTTEKTEFLFFQFIYLRVFIWKGDGMDM